MEAVREGRREDREGLARWDVGEQGVEEGGEAANLKDARLGAVVVVIVRINPKSQRPSNNIEDGF